MERRESTEAKTGFGFANPREGGIAVSKRAGQAGPYGTKAKHRELRTRNWESIDPMGCD